MKTEVCIFNLRGNFAAVREYANIIASKGKAASNAYVMVFGKDDGIIWVIQAGDETAQQDDDNDTQSDSTNEPSRLALAVKKVVEKAKKYAYRAAFLLSVVVVLALAFSICVAGGMLFASVLDAVGIEGSIRFALVLCAFVPSLDVALWVECNAIAVVARLFPCCFVHRRPEFLAPCSVFWAAYRGNLA